MVILINYEMSLLNSLIDAESIISAVEQNVDESFVDHKDIWEFIHGYYSKYSKLPTKAIVKNQFREFEFIDTTTAPLQFYVDEARKHALSENVRTTLHDTIQILRDSGPNAALNFVAMNSLRLMKNTGALKDTNLAGDFADRVGDYKERHDDPTKNIMGIPTGFSVIDKHFGGWQKGDFIVILGWTGSGKSWLARLFAANAWQAGYSPLIISLEMNKEQEGYRFDTILNQGETFRNSDLMFGRGVSPEAYDEWAARTFKDKPPIHLVTSDGIEAANQNVVEAKVEQYNPDLLILDYHGLFDDAKKGGTETERAKNLSKDFKRIAVRHNIPVIDIAAVTMDANHGERAPALAEVAWSKQLAYDADLVMAVHRNAESQLFEVVSRKVRRGHPFAFYLEWDLDTGKRKELFDA